MSDDISSDSLQTNKSDPKKSTRPLIHSNSLRRLSLLSAKSRSSQSSLDIKFVQKNNISSHKFAQFGRKVVTILNVTNAIKGNLKPAALIEDKHESRDSTDYNFISKIEETDIPSHPRFPATMSYEAQYSYLKGYQDLILKNLTQTKLPEIDSIRLTAILPKIDDDKCLHFEPTLKIKNNQTGFNSYRSNHKGNDSLSFPNPIQQICTSYRLQNALDILDVINDNNGKPTFSNHFKRHNIKPSYHFMIWEKSWKNDFQIRNRVK